MGSGPVEDDVRYGNGYGVTTEKVGHRANWDGLKASWEGLRASWEGLEPS